MVSDEKLRVEAELFYNTRWWQLWKRAKLYVRLVQLRRAEWE